MARTMAPVADDILGLYEYEGGPGSFSAATSVRGPSVRRSRSMNFREFESYASRGRTQTPATSSKPTTPVRDTFTELLPSPVEKHIDDFEYPHPPYISPLPPRNHQPYHYQYPQFHFQRPDSSASHDLEPSTHRYAFAPQTPATPLSLRGPRWYSVADSTNDPYNRPATATATAIPTASGSVLSLSPAAARICRPLTPNDEFHRGPSPLASEARDEFPPLSPLSKMSTMDSRPSTGDTTHVENFSRPRKSSIKQPYPESLRFRLAYASHTHSDPSQVEPTHNPYLLGPRARGQSNSSNKSTATTATTATFASLPVRPPPDFYSRGRQANPTIAQPALAYRGESHGPPLPRNPRPRMTSSDEMRSSFRSQLTSSTAQGTHITERSSIATKTSSVTSIYAQVDDGFSVDDVMGMYEKGFHDDSPAPAGHTREYSGHNEQEHEHDEQEHEDADSRPPTPHSERDRRKTLMLEAMSDSLSRPSANASDTQVHAKSGSAVRESTAMLRNSVASFPTEVTGTSSTTNGTTNHTTKHDSGKLLEDDDEDFPIVPKKQLTNLTTETELDDTRDRYGFRKENQYVTREQYETWNSGYTEYLARRKKKWALFLKESGLMTEDPNRFPPRSTKSKRFVRKGIPPEWRGAAWFYYAGGPAIVAKHAGVYDTLLKQKAKDVDNEAIERDLHRTFPDNVRFRSAGKAATTSSSEQTDESSNNEQAAKEPTGNDARPDETPMISSLRRVLHAFSIYNPKIGYCQSLNFLAGLLLLFVESEEHAFWLLNIITRVYLPGTHEMSLEGANVDLGVLMESLRESMPAVWAKIGGELDGSDNVKAKSRRGRGRKGADLGARLPPITLCMTAWFMSCFIGTLPIETTLRVWDVFFYEGSKTLFRIALAVFKIGEAEIKSVGDPMEIFQVVQTIPRRLLDANALMESCFKRRNGFGHLSQETVEQRREERRRNVKTERDRIAAGGPPGGVTFDESIDANRKNTLFSRKRNQRPAEV